LNAGHWIWGDGSLASLTQTIKEGVANPKQYSGVMPPLGGAELSQQQLAAVAAYVWAVGHARQ
jgi:mono/diheme cytochrome c family protein